MNFLLRRARTSIVLGEELGRGGEGAVYAVEARRDRVAKVYHRAPEPGKIAKLEVMVQKAASDLLSVAAWPVDLLVDKRNGVRGFVMPAVRARRDVHELYSPKSRFDAFPNADFRFLVHVAGNLSRAFAVVHEYGHVVGDVNHGSILVGPDGTVMLVDCDSFQIAGDSQLFTCDVGVPLFTAPELQGRSFRGLIRTVSHDGFGLAVLLFHLLFMGRHPFAGRYSGPGDMPIERAIAEYRFAYGPGQFSGGMERPPGTVPLETMGSEIVNLFLQAFGRTGVGRPAAATWVAALDRLKGSLRTCGTAMRHHLPRHLGSCPWCKFETETGVVLFGHRVMQVGPSGAVDLAALWQAIEIIPDPGADPPLPSERPQAPGNKFPSMLKMLRFAASTILTAVGVGACSAMEEGGGFFIALVFYSLAAAVWPRVPPERIRAANQKVAAARVEWERVLREFRDQASQVTFLIELESLRKARAELMNLPKERKRRLSQLYREREKRQREHYLDRFRIDRAQISRIGPSRTAMLASYGIESAADISFGRIQKIPGFGEVLASELEAWRDRHVRNFRFNPTEPVDPRDLATLDLELKVRRDTLIDKLEKGPAKLRSLRHRIVTHRPRYLPMLERSWLALKEAEAQRRSL